MKTSILNLARVVALTLAATATCNADSFSAIGFNGRKDVDVWQEGMVKLGAQKGTVVRDDAPALKALRDVFGRSDEWLYLAGHFAGDRLYNEGDTVGVSFLEDRVILSSQGATEELKRGAGFKQHQKLKVLFGGGCSTHADKPKAQRPDCFVQGTSETGHAPTFPAQLHQLKSPIV